MQKEDNKTYIGDLKSLKNKKKIKNLNIYYTKIIYLNIIFTIKHEMQKEINKTYIGDLKSLKNNGYYQGCVLILNLMNVYQCNSAHECSFYVYKVA